MLALHGGVETWRAFVSRDGAFTFDAVPPGTHKLEVLVEGAPACTRPDVVVAAAVTAAAVAAAAATTTAVPTPPLAAARLTPHG